MDKELKNFLIKVSIIGILTIFLYFIMSPYQKCIRVWGDDPSINQSMMCFERTNW